MLYQPSMQWLFLEIRTRLKKYIRKKAVHLPIKDLLSIKLSRSYTSSRLCNINMLRSGMSKLVIILLTVNGSIAAV